MASPRERVILLLKFVWYGEVFLVSRRKKDCQGSRKLDYLKKKQLVNKEELDMAF